MFKNSILKLREIYNFYFVEIHSGLADEDSDEGENDGINTEPKEKEEVSNKPFVVKKFRNALR